MSAAMAVDVLGIGVLGPGLPDWPRTRAVLRGERAWQAQPTMIPAPARLPPAERRRAGAIVKLSIAVADEASAQAGRDPAGVATVFSASSGDTANCHALCEVLASPTRLVSPTRFTNSVHNAAAGYWHIATASRAPSTSLCAHDGSFAAGLLEAACQCVSDGRAVLLVVGDTPYPEPLHATRPMPDAFAVALLIAPAGSAGALARLRIDLAHGTPGRCLHADLETLRPLIPAARALPLLEHLAQGTSGALDFEAVDGLALAVQVGA